MRRRFVASLALGVGLALSGGAGAQAAPCPNEAIREAQTSETLPLGTTYLPDCMALEMVSPPQKANQDVTLLRAFSRDGSRALFVAKAALGGTEGQQSLNGDNYVAGLGAAGWTTSPTSAPRSAEITFGGTAFGGPYAFSPDLGAWDLFGATPQQKIAGEGQIFGGDLGGAFSPLSPLLAPIDDSGTKEIIFFDSSFVSVGTAGDLSATVFFFRAVFSSTAYLPGDPRNLGVAESGDLNRYVAFTDSNGEPALELLARDKAGTVYGGLCGSQLGGADELTQGAISAEGSRIYFSTRPAQPGKVGETWTPCSTSNPLRIFKRTATATGPEVEELIPGAPSAAGDDIYQGASLDGTKVFLTSPRKLTASDQDLSSEACGAELGKSVGCDLYLYDSSKEPAQRLTQISAGEAIPGQHELGKAANVLSSLTAISPDGSHAYFVAQGVLSGENAEHDSPLAGQPNLYLYQRDAAHPAGQLTFIATLAPSDKGSLWGSGKSFANGAYAVPLLGGGEEGGGDGHILFFLSNAALTANDADGGHADLFRYESGAIECVSCAPAAEPFDALAGINQFSPSSNFAEQGRWASEDGNTVAFATAEALVPGDVDGKVSPYLWREGELAQLPGNMSQEPSTQRAQRPVVSADGSEVGFTATRRLLPQDGDTARDAYLVRVGGGFPNPAPPLICDPLTEGACQGAASQAGASPAAATESFSGPGNPPAPSKCRKGQVRKRGNCVKRHHAKKRHHKRASHKRRASK